MTGQIAEKQQDEIINRFPDVGKVITVDKMGFQRAEVGAVELQSH
jgi:hypothetical protein